MEELICVTSLCDYFTEGKSYAVTSDGCVTSDDGDDYRLTDEDVWEGRIGIYTWRWLALFTTASNHDASADDSEGGCRK